jgi:hypothetical protein
VFAQMRTGLRAGAKKNHNSAVKRARLMMTGTNQG